MTAAAIDHISQSARRLLWQFRDKPRVRSLVQAIGAEMNELETALAQVRDLRIPTEAGVQLDRDGALVGVARAGLTDTDYRAAILAQTLINRGQARIEDLLFALRQAVPDGEFEISEPVAATVRATIMTALGGGDPSPGTLADALDALLGGGIAHEVFYAAVDADARFTLAAGDTIQTSATLGLANDAQSTGGQLSGVAV